MQAAKLAPMHVVELGEAQDADAVLAAAKSGLELTEISHLKREMPY